MRTCSKSVLRAFLLLLLISYSPFVLRIRQKSAVYGVNNYQTPPRISHYIKGDLLGSTSNSLLNEPDKDLGKQQRSLYWVNVTAPGNVVQVVPGTVTTYPFTIQNLGSDPDVYTLSVSSSQGWADVENVSKSIVLKSGESKRVKIKVIIPKDTPVETTDELKLIARSQGDSSLFDVATVKTTVTKDVTLRIFSWIASFFTNLSF